MTAQQLNDALYDKMEAEQQKYKDHLLSLPPEEILNHTYEYSMREDILCYLQSNSHSPTFAKALLRSPCPLEDVYKAWSKRDSLDLCDALLVHAEEQAERYNTRRQQER